MPSSFTWILSSALGFSPRPPVSVWGTVIRNLKLRDFSWKHGINHFAAPKSYSSSRLRIVPPDFPGNTSYTLEPGRPTPGWPSLLRHPIAVTSGSGILTGFPSTTPFGLALGADSPCADERCAGTLGLSARRIFTSFIVTHVSIRTSDTSSPPPGEPSQAYRTLLYRRSASFNTLFPTSIQPVRSSRLWSNTFQES